MKFAVIEYSSKTGTVWRHRDDHPNYLADPDKEMDPTSFGCYVSALKGEHIPLTGLILGPVNHVSRAAQLWRKVVKRLTGNWPQSYALDYLKGLNVVLVAHQISDGHEVTAFTKRLKREFPRVMIMGVPTQPYGLLEQYWRNDEKWLRDFKEFAGACDVFISIVADTVPLWQQLLQKPVVYLPQPYPVEFASQHSLPTEKKQKVIYVAGVLSRPSIEHGFLVAAQLQQRFPDYVIQYVSEDDAPVQALVTARSEKVPFAQWQEHLTYLSQVALVINTDHTFTRGRVQVDCAAVGTPSIGANSDGQRDLFPDLPATVDTSVAELVEQGVELLEDPDWYNAVVARARERLQPYDYSTCAQRLIALVAANL